MAELHDRLASQVGNHILERIRRQDPSWRQVFSDAIHRHSDWGWPRPDYVCRDPSGGEESNVTYALEFKPPNQTKREYLTGLGQSLSYLGRHHYSGLIIPSRSDDNFPIGRYIHDLFADSHIAQLPISLIEYDPTFDGSDPVSKIRLLRGIKTPRSSEPQQSLRGDDSRYWAFWRDTSASEVFDLMRISDRYEGKDEDPYTTHIWPEFWKRLVAGDAVTWEGVPREISNTESNFKSLKQNYKIPLFRAGIWAQSDARLTREGAILLRIGKKFKPHSRQFVDCLAWMVLENGKHLDLLYDFDDFQKRSKGSIPAKSSDFFAMFEKDLEQRGMVGRRNEGRVTTKAKPGIRDEPKLWNKLGLLVSENGSYFKPGEGVIIDWRRIAEISRTEFARLAD